MRVPLADPVAAVLQPRLGREAATVVQIAQEEVAATFGTGPGITDVCDLDRPLGVGPVSEEDAARLATVA
ncbi:MAG TPA: hypothetical protein VGF95_15120 [Solirubrobacteraceae bacterium]